MPLVKPSSNRMAAIEESMEKQFRLSQAYMRTVKTEGSNVNAGRCLPSPGMTQRLRCGRFPVAVLDRQHDARIVAQAEVILGGVVHRALRDLDVAGVFQCILQG